MNYLAHLYFSEPTALAWAGSLMGDFVKGNDFSGMPDVLSRHLRLHRYIDTYTCRSQAFQRSRRRLNPRLRYARSVVVDVFYDHFLACQWHKYHEMPLSEFARQVYAGLQSCHSQLSTGLQDQLPRMIEYDWLSSYRQPQVVQRVLMRLEERIGHKFPLAQGFADLEQYRQPLESDFTEFMHSAMNVVTDWKSRH